jgi:hypothetical protein
MAKRALMNKPEKREKIIDLVALWKSRPSELREHKSLKELADANGITPNSDFYAIANSPEVLLRVITAMAGTHLDHTHEILEKLAEQAKTGHTRSAEIYLEWIRKIATDASLIEYVKPAQDMHQTLQDISHGAKEMIAIAKQLKDDNAIDSYLAEQAIDADFKDIQAYEIEEKRSVNAETERKEPA